MKKAVAFLVFIGGLLSLHAAQFDAFKVDNSGRISVEGYEFKATLANARWRWAEQGPNFVKNAPGMPQITADSMLVKGVFDFFGEPFDFTETIKRIRPNELDVEIDFKAPAPRKTALFFYAVTIPVKELIDRGIVINGKPFRYGAKVDPANFSRHFYNKHTTVEIPLAGGVLKLSGAFYIEVMDNRKFKHENWSIRIMTDPRTGAIAAKTFRVKMVYAPYKFTTIPLKKVANTGFVDEKPADGKGGWTDQGPLNDMRSFPVKQKKFAGVRFDVTDPATNNGKGVIGLFCDPHTMHYPKSATVAVNGQKGKNIYLLHALGWEPPYGTSVGDIVVRYTDNTTDTIPVISGKDAANFWRASQRKNAIVGWTGVNDLAQICMSVSRFGIKNKPIRNVEFKASGNGIWLIAGVTLTDDVIPTKPENITIMHPTGDWLLMQNRKIVEPGSVLDLSHMQDAPAGKYGFVRNVNGKFEFENRPGKPVRFFGSNIAFDVNFMENQHCIRLADWMKAAGFNILRLHHFDHKLGKIIGKTSTTLDEKYMERLDYWVHLMKERGIYVTLDLYTIRVLAKGEVEELPNLRANCPSFKALAFISPSAMKSWEDFTRNMLTHVNPYTKLAWKDDPAIVTISCINEDTIFANIDAEPQVSNLFRKKFDEYTAQKGIKITPQNRDRYWKIFLMEIYAKGYAHMKKFLRDLGVKALLTDQNMWANIPMTIMRNDFDVVDNHYYWQHPTFLGTAWRPPLYIGNRSLIDAMGGTMASMFPCRIFGKPLTMTEWDFCNPASYSGEGFLMAGAYSALQDWDGILQFPLASTPIRIKSNKCELSADLLNDPLRSTAIRGTAMLYLREDVAAAKDAYPMVLSETYMQDGNQEEGDPLALRQLGFVGRVGSIVTPKNGKPVLPAGTRAVISMEKHWNQARVGKPVYNGLDNDLLAKLVESGAVPAGSVDVKNRIFKSSTGELILNHKEHTFQAVTPRSECFVMKQGKSLEGKYAKVENKYSYGAFFISSCDKTPLKESRRIMLLHLTDLKGNLSRFRGENFNVCESWGNNGEFLVKRGEAVITLNAPAGLKVYACNIIGQRLREVPHKRVNGKMQFVAKTNWHKDPVIVYEIAK